jgi:Fe-S-cluster containining protein
VRLDDAEREPKIKEHGSPIYASADCTASGKEELEGYMLNDVREDGYECVFLDQTSNLCSIYDTRHWACRVFDCDGEGKEQLIELGILPRSGRTR